MDQTFKAVAERFEELKTKFQSGALSRQEFIEAMKKLRLKDDSGRFWMIGAQTGKWYYFDGKEWVLSEPPTQKDQKFICVYCGFENQIEAETCVRCGGTIGEEKNRCPICGGELEKPFLTCRKCSTGPEPAERPDFAASAGLAEPAEVVVRAVHPLSLLLFGGLFGALAGVVLGVFAGATAYFGPALAALPAALTDLQGKILGAVIFGLLGGIGGFVLLAVVGFLKAVAINFVLSLCGGIRLTVTRKAISPGSRDVGDFRERDPGPGSKS